MEVGGAGELPCYRGPPLGRAHKPVPDLLTGMRHDHSVHAITKVHAFCLATVDARVACLWSQSRSGSRVRTRAGVRGSARRKKYVPLRLALAGEKEQRACRHSTRVVNRKCNILGE